MMKKNLNILKALLLFIFLAAIPTSALADDFTVERAVNLGQLDSWADISKFQWEEINQVIQDNGAEMDALKEVFRDPAPTPATTNISSCVWTRPRATGLSTSA